MICIVVTYIGEMPSPVKYDMHSGYIYRRKYYFHGPGLND